MKKKGQHKGNRLLRTEFKKKLTWIMKFSLKYALTIGANPCIFCFFGVWRSLASALALGARGRRFKSDHPEILSILNMHLTLFFISTLVSALGTVAGFGGGVFIVPFMVM